MPPTHKPDNWPVKSDMYAERPGNSVPHAMEETEERVMVWGDTCVRMNLTSPYSPYPRHWTCRQFFVGLVTTNVASRWRRGLEGLFRKLIKLINKSYKKTLIREDFQVWTLQCLLLSIHRDRLWSEVFYSGELLCVNGTPRPSTEYHHHHHN